MDQRVPWTLVQEKHMTVENIINTIEAATGVKLPKENTVLKY